MKKLNIMRLVKERRYTDLDLYCHYTLYMTDNHFKMSRINKNVRVNYGYLSVGDYIFKSDFDWYIHKDNIRFQSNFGHVNWFNDEEYTNNDKFNSLLMNSEAEWEAEQLSRVIGSTNNNKKKVRL